MSSTIRRATPDDITTLRKFEAKLVEHERAVVPTLRQEGELQYYDIESLIADPNNALVLVAEIDGRAVGCGLGQIRDNEPIYNESRFGYIGLMYVDETARGQNVGREIIQRLIAWFRENEINEIRLKVYANNKGAVRAYEKLGFETDVLEMRLAERHE